MAEEEKNETAEVEEEEQDSGEPVAELEDLEAAMTDEEGEEEEQGPVKPVVKHEGKFYGTGRRKESIARVWVEAGNGNITVNDKTAEEYFMNRPVWIQDIEAPFECIDFEGKIDVKATLEGGGKTGQSGALKLGIARALIEMDENARHWLHADGLLTRDDRKVERKKINQPGARAKAQVSKR